MEEIQSLRRQTNQLGQLYIKINEELKRSPEVRLHEASQSSLSRSRGLGLDEKKGAPVGAPHLPPPGISPPAPAPAQALAQPLKPADAKLDGAHFGYTNPIRSHAGLTAQALMGQASVEDLRRRLALKELERLLAEAKADPSQQLALADRSRKLISSIELRFEQSEAFLKAAKEVADSGLSWRLSGEIRSRQIQGKEMHASALLLSQQLLGQISGGLDVKLSDALQQRQLGLLKEIHVDFATLQKHPEVLVRGAAAAPELKALIADLAELEHRIRNPSMPVEEKKAVIAAAGYSGPGLDGNGHWFTCPNGHPYVIGECGGAVQESTCPECGHRIGGSGYQLASGNRALSLQ